MASHYTLERTSVSNARPLPSLGVNKEVKDAEPFPSHAALYVVSRGANVDKLVLEDHFLRAVHGGDGHVDVKLLKGLPYCSARLAFSSVQVAERVFALQHKISGTDLILYKTEAELRASARTEGVAGCVVLIKPLPAHLTSNRLKRHFMHAKNGGNGCVKIEIIEGKQKSARLTFNSVQVTDDVLNMKHTVDGVVVHLQRPFEILDTNRTLLLSKLPLNTTDEDITIHFTKSCHGGDGGDVEIFRTAAKPDQAELQFESQTTVDNVLAQKPHVLKGQEIDVHRINNEVFTSMRAVLNPRKLRLSEEDLLPELNRVCGVNVEKQNDAVFVEGSFEQMCKVHSLLALPTKRGVVLSSSSESLSEATDQPSGSVTGTNTEAHSSPPVFGYISGKDTSTSSKKASYAKGGGAQDEKEKVFKLRGVTVVCRVADMTQLKVEGVVNVVNSRAQLDVGLAKALSLAAGPKMKVSCEDYIHKNRCLREGEAFTTGGFMLNAKKVIHVNSGRISLYNIDTCLEKAVRAALDEAEINGLESVAFPAIGSGFQQIPAVQVAESLVSAINKHLEGISQYYPVKKIYLVDRSETAVDAFAKAMTAKDDRPATKTSVENRGRAQEKKSDTVTDVTKENQERIEFLKPEIVGYMFKVFCPVLKLQGGSPVREIWSSGENYSTVVVSKSDTYEFNKAYTHYLNSTSFSSIDIESRCKFAAYRIAEKASRKSLDLCIRAVDNEIIMCGSQTAIDRELGGLEYRLTSEVCSRKCPCKGDQKHTQEAFLSLSASSQNKDQWTSKKEHQVETFSSRTDVQGHFLEKHSGMTSSSDFNTTPASASSTAGSTLAVSSVQPSNFMKGEMTNCEFSVVPSIQIFAYRADMCKICTDAIVSTIDDNFFFIGALATALSQAAGPELKRKCQDIRHQKRCLTMDSAFVTPGYNLPCQVVIHVNVTGTEASIENALRSVFQLVDEHRIQSLALPALGAGSLGLPIDSSVAAILRSIEKYSQVRGTGGTLQQLHLVDVSTTTVTKFQSALLKWKNDRSLPAKVNPAYNFRGNYSSYAGALRSFGHQNASASHYSRQSFSNK